MTYQVKWVQTAEDELMLLWMQADSATRQAINTASQRIDAVLASDPLTVGESREEDFRVVFVPPLGVSFQVDTNANTVWVASVWLCE